MLQGFLQNRLEDGLKEWTRMEKVKMERPFWLIAASKEGSVNKSGKLCANERGALRGTCHFDIIGSGPGVGLWERGKKDLHCSVKVDGWSKLCVVSL